MYQYRLTEEIARWGFEIVCQKSKDWEIAFTNPTAGPWKTVKGKNPAGEEGEVHRFGLEDLRPDIILVNDALCTIVIIEAKDSIKKLLTDKQSEKSVQVVADLAQILQDKRENPYWGARADYDVVTGLLWGADKTVSSDEREAVFEKYHDLVISHPGLDASLLLGIETRKDEQDDFHCVLFAKQYDCDRKAGANGKIIASSLGIPLIQQ